MLKKSLLTVLLLLSCIIGAGELKAQKTLPYSYDFEFTGTYNETNAKAALTAEGWTLTNESNNSYIRRYMYNNTYSFEFLVDESKDYQYLISPLLSDASALSIEFYWKTTASTTVKYKIGYSKSDTPDVTTNFTWSDEVTCTWQSAYTLASQAFSTDGIKYIAIMFDRNGDTSTSPSHYLVIDDITISQYVAPTNLTASALVTSASISWNAGNDETNWLLYYSTNNSAPSASIVTPSDNVKAVNGNPTYTITGLTDGTTYYAWVRSNYGNDNYSSWVGPVELQTSSNKTHTANEGTASVYYVPIAGYNVTTMTKSQFIIPSTDLEDMIGSNVTQLTFYTTTGSKTWGDATFKIYMKEVAYTVFSSTDFENFTNDELCYNGSLSVDASKHMEITLSNAYKYNGGNLMVYFCLDHTGTNTSNTFYGIDTEDYSSLYHYGTSTTYLKRDKHLPKITFTYTYAETFDTDGNWTTGSGAPAATDYVLVQSNITIANGTNATANVIDIDAGSLTIANGATLTCNDINTIGGSVTIADGGQLITNSAVTATVQKTIDDWDITNWYFISSPVGNTDPSSVTGMITDTYTGDDDDQRTYDLYSLDMTQVECWQNYRLHEFSLVNGMGYLYASKGGTTLSFTGNIQPSNEDVTLNGLNSGFNLVGNPFTCDAYLDQSYYMLVDGNTISASATGPSSSIAPCLGVIIDGTSVTFSKTKQTDGSANNGNIELTLTQAVANTRGEAKTETLDNAIVSFNQGSQLGKFYFGTQNANIYIPQNGKEYAIVSAEAQGEMPVCFKAAKDGQYTITVNPEEVEVSYLHLIDNIAGTEIDLLATPSYTFNAKADDYESRFRLMFTTNSVDEISAENSEFAFISNGQLIVTGEGTLQIVDMTGRVLVTKQLSTINSQLPTANLKAGVYVLRLINGENVKTQKIVVR